MGRAGLAGPRRRLVGVALVPREAAGRELRWARRDKDLCIVGGLWFRNLEVVPFGRMQVVKVSSGPLLRAYGLANVELVTAAAATNGIIPGLPADEAKALRDLIIELSDAEGSGL